MFKFKEVGKVPWKWSTLKPGDCIYIPASELQQLNMSHSQRSIPYCMRALSFLSEYLHQVRSYGRSISWTMLWAPATDIDFSDCDGVNLDKPMLLIDTTPMWTYVDADRVNAPINSSHSTIKHCGTKEFFHFLQQLSNVRLNAASLRHHLLVLLRDEDQLRQETFRDFFEEIMSEVCSMPIPLCLEPHDLEKWNLM